LPAARSQRKKAGAAEQDNSNEKRFIDLREQTASGRWGRRDCVAAELLSTQVFRKTGESISSPSPVIFATVLVNASQQYEDRTTFAMTKMRRKPFGLGIAHPPRPYKGAQTLTIREGALLKSSASRNEKTSCCNRNGAAADEHF